MGKKIGNEIYMISLFHTSYYITQWHGWNDHFQSKIGSLTLYWMQLNKKYKKTEGFDFFKGFFYFFETFFSENWGILHTFM